mgnify:CR=1 FL=1
MEFRDFTGNIGDMNPNNFGDKGYSHYPLIVKDIFFYINSTCHCALVAQSLISIDRP